MATIIEGEARQVPCYIACVDVDVNFGDCKAGRSQVRVKIRDEQEHNCLRRAEIGVISAALDRDVSSECLESMLYVMVPELVPCVRGLSTTLHRASDLGKTRLRMLLLARPRGVWSYVNENGNQRSGLCWDLDCVYMHEDTGSQLLLYQVSPALQQGSPYFQEVLMSNL
jgi:hypothetical protein